MNKLYQTNDTKDNYACDKPAVKCDGSQVPILDEETSLNGKFLVDSMLTSLGNKLGLLGIDCFGINDPNVSEDSDILKNCDRIVLTKSHAFVKLCRCKTCYFV